MKEYVFGREFRKHADAERYLDFEFFPLVANFWESEKQYSTADIVRPRYGTGFAYQAGGDGQSGAEQPEWPKTLSGTVVDGEITWTAIAAGSNGVTAVSSPSISITPSGELSAGSTSVIDGVGTNTRIRTLLTGGTLGRTYALELTVTAGSETIVGSLVVRIVAK